MKPPIGCEVINPSAQSTLDRIAIVHNMVFHTFQRSWQGNPYPRGANDGPGTESLVFWHPPLDVGLVVSVEFERTDGHHDATCKLTWHFANRLGGKVRSDAIISPARPYVGALPRNLALTAHTRRKRRRLSTELDELHGSWN